MYLKAFRAGTSCSPQRQHPDCHTHEYHSGKTKAPARFTEATLLSAMENPVRYMSSDDNKMKKNSR